jgi:hypothetical protein
MKIKFLIIFFLITANGFSQEIHNLKNYKISEFIFSDQSSVYNPKTINRILNSIIVTPNESQYPVSNFITDIFVSGDTVWFATGSGLMRTIDNFNSFQNYFGIEPFGEDDISGLNVFQNIIAVATATGEELNDGTVPVGTGIKISTDRGLNWNAFPQPLDTQADSTIQYGQNTLYALPVVVRQQNLSYDIAITRTQNDPGNFTIWITSFAGGLRKSTDYGNTWERVLLPPDNLDSININVTGYTFSLDPRTNLNHRAFTVTAMNDSTLFVGTANGINRSTDWGKNWRKFNYQNSGTGTNRVSGNFVVKLKVQEFSGTKVIWGATRRAEDNNELNALSYAVGVNDSWSYTLNDQTPNGISFKDSIVYGLTNSGVWHGMFGEFNWSRPSLIYDEETKDVLKPTVPSQYRFFSGAAIGDTVYFGSADGLLRTTESGLPWVGKWKIYRAISPINLSSDIKTYAAPNPFAPDDEVVRIFFKTNKTNTKVTLRVFDFAMNPVRTILQNASRSDINELFTQWDGKNDEGFQAANGVYFYRVEFDNEDPVWGKIILLQ